MISLFGTKYKNEQLILTAERALNLEPAIDVSNLTISSEKGIVTIGGKLKTAFAKRHAIESVEKAFRREGLKFDKILDRIEVS